MNIEGKAKRYDEAIERAKKWYNAPNVDKIPTFGNRVIEEIFPELKESEDEKIRKEIINIFHSLADGIIPVPINFADIFTWLEKQGKQIIDCPQNHQDTGHPNGCIVMEDFNGGEGFYKLNLDYLNKKQVREIEEIIKAWNTKSNDDIIRDEIIKVCVGMALTDVPQSRFESYGTSLKECLTWLEKQGELVNSLTKGLDNAHERIDELIQKNNELCIKLEKQGEQKPADKVEPKFKVKYAGNEYNVLEVKDIAGVTFYGIEDEPNHIDYVLPDNCEIISGYGVKEKGSPYPTKSAIFSEKKSTWSEEDMSKVQRICKYLDEAKKYYADITEVRECMNWLKSLKDRVIPQSKQEWSEEDERNLQGIIDEIEANKNQAPDYDLATYDRFHSWLKSLRPQNHWKPSKEQMQALLSEVEGWVKGCPKQKALESLYNDLKKLREGL